MSSRCGGLFGFFIATAVPEAMVGSPPCRKSLFLIEKMISDQSLPHSRER
jgi:hypothetical protein